MNVGEWNQIIIGAIGSLLAAGIIYIVSWLSSFRSIPVPLWVIGFFAAVLIFYGYSQYQRSRPELTTVFEKEFGIERITLDGKHFVQCKFNGTELIFLGQKPFSMTRNTGEIQKFTFEDKAALTVTALKKIYNDLGMRAFAESFIQEIQKP